ncbi:MAG: TIGR01777 family oxidoreductase [Sciscionella sp.]
MRVLIAGASGYLGTSLCRQLAAQGHQVQRLVRRVSAGPDEVSWDPYRGELPVEAVVGIDAAVCLNGVPIAHWPWTSAYRQLLVSSRVEPARALAKAVARAPEPRPALVCASAVGYYGDRGDTVLRENAAPGNGFLADLTRQWEGATEAAQAAGCRVVSTRTGVVLGPGGGALAAMLIPFRCGLGARLGSGRQYFPTVSLHDYLAATTWTLTDSSLAGAVNVTGPVPATNADFTREMSRLLHRRAAFSIPSSLLRTVLGSDLAGQFVGSVRVVPQRLTDAGFAFAHPDVRGQLAAALR